MSSEEDYQSVSDEDVKRMVVEIHRALFYEGLDGKPSFYKLLKAVVENEGRRQWFWKMVNRIVLFLAAVGAIWVSFKAELVKLIWG